MPEKIKGQRKLNGQEIDAINLFKTIEAQLNSQMELMKYTSADARSLAIAATHLETAFMYIEKSIAKPDRMTDPVIDKAVAQALADAEEKEEKDATVYN